MEETDHQKPKPACKTNAMKNNDSTTVEKKGIKLIATGKKHDGGGVRSSLHGTVYQANLLLLFMKKAQKLGYKYNIATEVDEAYTFDDICFEYQKNETNVYKFLQAKHRQNFNNPIVELDLTNETDGDFSVLKYYIAYCKMKSVKRTLLQGQFEEFTICTNLNIDPTLEEHFLEIEETDDFLTFDKTKYAPRARRLKLRKDSALFIKISNRLRALSENNQDHEKILKKIGAEIAKEQVKAKEQCKKKNQKNNIVFDVIVETVYKDNRDWILETIFDLDTSKKDKQKYLLNFKRDFLYSDDDTKRYLNEKLIDAYTDNLKKILGTSSEKLPDIIKDINYAAIRDQLANVWFRLGKSFFDKPKGKDKKVMYSEHEVEVFLDKFVLAVSQPNINELKNVLFDEIGSLNLNDGGLVAGHLQACIIDWVTEKHGTFVSDTDFINLMADIERLFISIRLSGLALEQKATIEKYGCRFKCKDTLQRIHKFINSDKLILFLFYHNKLLTDMKITQTQKENIMTVPYHKDNELTLNSENDLNDKDVAISRTDEQGAENATQSQGSDNTALTLDNTFHFMYFKMANFMTSKISEICPVEAFRSKANSSLVVELTEPTELNSTKDLIKKISGLEVGTQKKLFVVIPFELQDKINNVMSEDTMRAIKYEAVVDNDIFFADLNEKSQQKLLNEGTIKVRGCRVSIKDLDLEQLKQNLKGYELSQLIQNKWILYEKNELDQQYKEVKNCYVDRSIRRQVCISSKIFSDDRFQKWEGDPKITQKEIIIVDNDNEIYNRLCSETKNIVHWLKFHNGGYFWQESRGSLNNLQNYKRNVKCSTNTNTVFHINSVVDLYDRIVVISAQPGMGKSITLAHLEEQSNLQENSDFYILKINFRDCYKIFKDMPDEKLTIIQGIIFLYMFFNMGSVSEQHFANLHMGFKVNDDGFLTLKYYDNNDLNWIQLQLFKYMYNERKIIILFDGFDEIAPDYTDKVLNLLEVLKDCRIHKLWVTTRSYNIKYELENRLNTFSYELLPLSEKEMLQLILILMWRRLNLSFDKAFIESLVADCYPNGIDLSDSESSESNGADSIEHEKHSTSSESVSRFSQEEEEESTSREYVGIPLHAWMYAIICTDTYDSNFVINKFMDNFMSVNFTIYDIYTKFFKIKFKEFWRDVDENNPKYAAMFNKEYLSTLTRHHKMALMAICSKNEVLEELVSEEEWEYLVETVSSGNEKTGFVTHVDADRPRFLHQTFAEYFVADYLADIIISKNIQHKSQKRKYNAAKEVLYETLTSKRNETVILFFNYKVASTSPDNKAIFNTAIDYNPDNFDRFHNNFDLNIRDALGRTVIHLMFSSGNVNRSQLQECLSLFVDYRRHLYARDDLFEWSPLHYAIACHNCNEVAGPVNMKRLECERFYFQQEKVDLIDKEGLTPYLLAARRGCSDRCINAFLCGLPINLNVQDYFGMTALHHALFRDDINGVNFVRKILDFSNAVFLIKMQPHFPIKLKISTNVENESLNLQRENDDMKLNDVKHIFSLIENNKKINTPDDQGNLPSYNLAEIVELLSEDEPDISAKISSVLEFIQKECISSKMAAIDVNFRALCDKTPLHYAFENLSYENRNNILFLIRNGADIEIPDDEGRLPSYYDPEELLKIFVKGHSPSKFSTLEEILDEDRETMTPFILSMEFNDDIAVHILSCYKTMSEVLISKNKILLNTRDSHGRTGLHYAMKFINYTNVAYLLMKGIDVNAFDNSGRTPLEYRSRNTDKLDDNESFHLEKNLYYLLKYGAYYNITNDFDGCFNILDFIDTLFTAVKTNNVILVEQLLIELTAYDWHVNHIFVNVRSKEGGRPIHYAVINNRLDIVKLLLSYGAAFNSLGLNDKTPFDLANNEEIHDFLKLMEDFFAAVYKNDIEQVRNCIDNGAIVNAGYMQGSQLCYAHLIVFENAQPSLDMLDLLLQNGAKLELETMYGEMVFHLATKLQLKHIVKAILSYVRSNITYSNKIFFLLSRSDLNYYSPLDYSFQHGGNIEIALMLLKYLNDHKAVLDKEDLRKFVKDYIRLSQKTVDPKIQKNSLIRDAIDELKLIEYE